MTEKQDVYSRVTDKIIADIEGGNLTWLQPWQAGGHKAGAVSSPFRAGGIPYRGVNVLMLWASAMEKGYNCPLWLTYKQAAELGGQVRKGEKGSLVVYANTFTKTGTDEQGAEVETEIPFMKGYTVFNAEQIDGLPAHFYATVPPLNNAISGLNPPSVSLPAPRRPFSTAATGRFTAPTATSCKCRSCTTFRDAESYYATLAHEMTHWTRHSSRLDRDLGRKRFADAGYAMEELVAEIGAAFLCADLGITPETRDDHAAYIASWLKVLKNDKRAIFTAASHAQKAADYLHGLQPKAEAATGDEMQEAA